MPTDTTLPTEYEDDWKLVRPERHNSSTASLSPAPELESEPVQADGLEDPAQFAEDLRNLARALRAPRVKLPALRTDLLSLARAAGLNRADVPEGRAGNAYDFLDYWSLGRAPTTPSSALGLRLLGVLIMMAQRGTRFTCADDLSTIADDIFVAGREDV